MKATRITNSTAEFLESRATHGNLEGRTNYPQEIHDLVNQVKAIYFFNLPRLNEATLEDIMSKAVVTGAVKEPDDSLYHALSIVEQFALMDFFRYAWNSDNYGSAKVSSLLYTYLDEINPGQNKENNHET